MKKNGKRSRRIQREKELKKIADLRLKVHICQEVDDIHTAQLAIAHIITHNPVVWDTMETKQEYFRRLNSYIKTGRWDRRKFENAELIACEKILFNSTEEKEEHDISFYRYYILLDMMHILAYECKPSDVEKMTRVKERYMNDFKGCVDNSIVDKVFRTFVKARKRVKPLLKEPGLAAEKEYIQLIEKNIRFKKKEPFGIMVTATMSAGKSTLINALTGKYICLSQNMACTSKIHCIVNKAFEDGFSAEYDHDLVLTADREELLNNNELNSSDKIVVSTNFTGELTDQRIIVNDSPGVNYSGDEEHKRITERLIRGRNYHLLIYVMNATQLGTNDESGHLDYVKKTIGRTPVLFVINKVDTFNVEEEDIGDAIQRQIEILKEKGFRDPLVCPVSSRAGYLAKQYAGGKLSRTEKRELYNYVDKFEQMNLKKYYARAFKKIVVEDAECEEQQLVKTSGLAYVEKIILAMIKGGNTNGSSTR